MAKLLDILFEALRESKTINLGKEFFPQAESLWKKAQTNFSIGKEGLIGELKLFDPYKKEKVSISVNIINDEDKGLGKFNKDSGITVNMAKAYNKEEFIDILYHEAVHAIDPKSGKVTSTMATNRQNYGAYASSPQEFDAVTSQSINILSRNLEKLDADVLPMAKNTIKKLANEVVKGEYIDPDKYKKLLPLFASHLSFNQFFEMYNNTRSYNIKNLRKLAQRLSNLL